MMKVNVISRKLIKPCKPTPSHLSIYNISLLEELNSPINVFRILYYPSHVVAGKIISLEEPLAQVLSLFYPIAGRYNKEKHQIDCNDDGAEYAVAEVDCRLDQVIGVGTKSKQLNHLLPVDICAADEPTDAMLAVQINRFQCGGLTIAICASHRFFDSASLGMFLKVWANAANDGELVIRPNFDSSSYFPSEKLPQLRSRVSRTGDKSIVAKKFVFDKNIISILRESLSTKWRSKANTERPPSRVVVVSALLTQALLRADRAKHGKSRASLIVQAIDLRERTVPPVPKHCCGSLFLYNHLKLTADESHNIMKNFVRMSLKLRQAIIQGMKDCTRILSDKMFGRWVLVDSHIDATQKSNNPDYKVIRITDWSKFGEYELDFGFGKPIWVSLADVPLKDLFILMNTKDNDGIEAWVYLDESDMVFFEQDEDLRIFTSE
ncbi:hypothetical protein DH2020_020200 [Rehmannia glutinosa]|uniref:Uncharacterized protein n=1 Tax=Rehmannia glutinosa TaxID=99300 RepID=A0ABR0WFF3_REHGL